MTLFVVQAASSAPHDLERARVVKEGFSWPAFVFAQLWLLRHGLWLALAIWVALEVAYIAAVAPHVPLATSILVDAIAHLFIGLEGNRLRLRRDAAIVALIEARDRDEAETLFFRRIVAGPAERAA